jgi:hypothetical protein
LTVAPSAPVTTKEEVVDQAVTAAAWHPPVGARACRFPPEAGRHRRLRMN